MLPFMNQPPNPQMLAMAMGQQQFAPPQISPMPIQIAQNAPANDNPIATPATRDQLREQLLAGKKKFESTLPPSNVTIPAPWLDRILIPR